MRQIYFFDLSGVLFETSQVKPMIGSPKPTWDHFYSKCLGHDKPRDDMMEIFNCLYPNFDCFVWTGRPEYFRQRTIQQLHREGITMSVDNLEQHLFMRPDGDFRSNVNMKKHWINSMLSVDADTAMTFFEDDPKHVSMLQEFGTTLVLNGRD